MEEEKKTNWNKVISAISYTIILLIIVGALSSMSILKNEEQENENNIVEQAPVINNVSYEILGYETKTRNDKFDFFSRRGA